MSFCWMSFWYLSFYWMPLRRQKDPLSPHQILLFITWKLSQAARIGYKGDSLSTKLGRFDTFFWKFSPRSSYQVLELGNGETAGLAIRAFGVCDSFDRVCRTLEKSVKSYNMDGSNCSQCCKNFFALSLMMRPNNGSFTRNSQKQSDFHCLADFARPSVQFL